MTFPPLPGFLSGDRVPEPDYAMILTAYSAIDNTRTAVVGINDGQLVRLNQTLDANTSNLDTTSINKNLAITPDGRWLYTGTNLRYRQSRGWAVDRLTFTFAPTLPVNNEGFSFSPSFGGASDLLATTGGGPRHVYRLNGSDWVQESIVGWAARIGPSVAIAPDDTLIVFGTRGGTGVGRPLWDSYLYNGSVWELIQSATALDTSYSVHGLTISPSSHMLTCSQRGTVRRYTRSGNLWVEIAGLSNTGGTVGALSWSPDERLFAVSGTDTAPKVFSVAEDGITFTLLPFPGGVIPGTVYCMAFSPDSSCLAVCSAGAPYLSVFAIDGTTFTKLPDMEPPISGPVYADVVFHPGYQPA